MDEEVDYEEEDRWEEEKRRRRSRQPRFGSFVTIAVALLLLFGAASRMGKIPETAALFGIDNHADDRYRREEERYLSLINIGPTRVDTSDRQPGAGRVHIDPNPQPPSRGEFNPDEFRHNSLTPTASMIRQDDRWEEPEYADDTPNGQYHEPEPQLSVRQEAQASTYVVANGDTWAKIAKRTLGSPNRWEELRRANPSASDGLRVGMRLVIPN